MFYLFPKPPVEKKYFQGNLYSERDKWVKWEWNMGKYSVSRTKEINYSEQLKVEETILNYITQKI